MGNQQLLLIAVGVVIVGIMLAVGISMFQDQASSSNRDELLVDLLNYGSRVQAFYRRPMVFGGGESSFRGLTMDKITAQSTNANGTYTLSPDPVSNASLDHVTLTGVGTEAGLIRTQNVKVVIFVYADSMTVDEVNGN